jgi:hypothetical protein
LKNLGPEFSNATGVEAVEKILSRLSPVYGEVITSWVPREKCKDLTQWGQAIGKFLSDLKPEGPLEGADLFAEIVNPDLMEKEISRSIRLEEAIDRKIKRIMQVKAAKQIFPNMRKNAVSEPRLINAGASSDAQLPAIIESERISAAHPVIIVSANTPTPSLSRGPPTLTKSSPSSGEGTKC